MGYRHTQSRQDMGETPPTIENITDSQGLIKNKPLSRLNPPQSFLIKNKPPGAINNGSDLAHRT